jgi:hypothetical protein
MGKLFTFGCSFTEDFEKVPKYGGTNGGLTSMWAYIEMYLDGKVPKSWPKILSEKLGSNLKNYGEGGKSNMRIFENFISKCDEIKPDDIVIINWTGLSRFKWAYKKNFISVLPNTPPYGDGEINKSTMEDILINRCNEIWKSEIYNFIKIINKLSDLVGFEVFYWSTDEIIINSESDEFRSDRKYLLGDCTINDGNPFSVFRVLHDFGAEPIYQETNNQVMDYHYGKTGHEIIADLFYKHIKKIKIDRKTLYN